MGNEIFTLEPQEVPYVSTKYRKICTQIPVPESIPILERLRKVEPLSMTGQPPILWDKAQGINVFDPYGNIFLDFSSGVLVTNAGHARKEICDAIIAQVNHGLIHNYCFPSELRLHACEKILSIAPSYLKKVFMLTTGAEATECALKLARTWGHRTGKQKNIIISFENAFHGRTLGSQMMGGSPALKDWIVNLDPDIIQVPFPDGFYNENINFSLFEQTLKQKNINPENVCGVITESYQGGGADFFPMDYVQKLRKWCDAHQSLLIFDEVQAGFGRTGKMFAFQNYNVEADLVCMGKGISSGLPVSGVLGRQEIMDQYPPGSMTSTHSGNPLCCASVIANIDLIMKEKLVENAAKLGEIFQKELQKIVCDYEIIGSCHGKGLVAGLQVVQPNTTTPDKVTANRICEKAIQQGLMMFAPVGKATLKLAPPLCITEDALREGCAVLHDAIGEVECKECE